MIAAPFRFYSLKPVSYSRYCLQLSRKYSVENKNEEPVDEEFRVLELYPVKQQQKKISSVNLHEHVLPPREKKMKTNQDWPSVWPTAQSFRPSVVPLPVYQGYDQKRVPPGKYANAELMKIPNFLHLTPLAVKRHCEAIKKFCTDFPEALKTDQDCHNHFPVEIITSDYCHSSPTIRDERSRIVTLKIKLKALNLDYHGRDKLIRLVGPERYEKTNGMLTIVADRCPLRKQNYDYLIYLLTALHHESWVTEPWEHEKTEADMEKFFFENSRIEEKVCKTLAKVKSVVDPQKAISEEEIKNSGEFTKFAESVTALINEGEDDKTLLNYKEAVLNVLNLKTNESMSKNQ